MPVSRRTDTLKLAGVPVFVGSDGRISAIEQKDALLLAYLAIVGPTPRRKLAVLLWPDVDTERARANLRQRLFRLRKTLGRELLEGDDVATLCRDIAVDIDAGASGGLLQGLADPEAGELADWLVAAREARRTEQIRTLAERSSRHEQAGQLAPALAAAEQLLDIDPTSEHAHRRLMRLHYLRGDRAAALAAFDRCCDVLEQTLGIAPDAETEALRAQVETATLRAEMPQTRPLPVSVLRPPFLVGRDAEWRTLLADWAAGTATLIAGEAGLGKSRLVGDFARAHPDALPVDARPGDSRVPHALLSRLLREVFARTGRESMPAGVTEELARLLPELGRAATAPAAAANTRFVNAVESALRHAHASGVSGLVVDDLQFADAASVETLQHLAATGIGLRWIVAFRPDELSAAARSFNDVFIGSGGARLHVLAPLATAQIGELIDSLAVADFESARLAPLLARHTGGNPLFLLETLKLMYVSAPQALLPADPATTRIPAPLPAGSNVTRLIEQRIGRLSATAVKLARCAAIAGSDFSAELAAHVLGMRALDLTDAWSELDAAQVLRDGVFAHDLIFEAALASVPTAIARRLHAEVAAFIESRSPEPAHVAEHWLASGDEKQALPWLIAAADRAAAAWRPAEEAAFLLRAVRIMRAHGGDPRAAFALLERTHRACLQGDLGSAAHLEVLELLASLADGPLERGHAHYARADTLGQQGIGPAAEAEARIGLAAIAGVSGSAADALHLDLVSALANGLFIQDRADEGVTAVRAAEPRLLALNDRHREIGHYANLGALLDAGNRHAEAQATMRHVISLARAEGDPVSELVVLSNLASSLHDTGQVSAALGPLDEAIELKRRFPELRTSALFVQVQMGNMQRGLGHYGEALRWLDEGMTILGRYTPQFVTAVHHGLARLWFDLGQRTRAQQHLALALDIVGGPPLFSAMAHLTRARAALADGRRAVAAEALASADSFIIDSTRYAVRAQLRLLACRLHAPDLAYREAVAVAHEAGRLQMQGVRIDALCTAAASALVADQAAVAASHAVEALALWPEHVPDALYIGELWRTAVDCLDAAGDPRAGDVLANATTWITATSRDHVPAEFRDSFRDRNPANLALLARAGRATPTALPTAGDRP